MSALVLRGGALKRAVVVLAALAGALGLAIHPAQAFAAGSAQVLGRVVDGTGAPVAATVTVLVNRDGGLVPLLSTTSHADGSYAVSAPAGEPVGILASLPGGRQGWAGGGGVSEPNSYLELSDGETRHVADANVGGGHLAARVAPAVRGIRAVGHTLAVSRGSWNAAPSGYRYLWMRNGAPIRGAYGATYRLTRYDVARAISVRVVAVRSGYSAGAAYSTRFAVRSH